MFYFHYQNQNWSLWANKRWKSISPVVLPFRKHQKLFCVKCLRTVLSELVVETLGEVKSRGQYLNICGPDVLTLKNSFQGPKSEQRRPWDSLCTPVSLRLFLWTLIGAICSSVLPPDFPDPLYACICEQQNSWSRLQNFPLLKVFLSLLILYFFRKNINW